MGMRLTYVSVPDSSADELRREPELAASILSSAELEGVSTEAMQQVREQLRAAGFPESQLPQVFPQIAGGDDGGATAGFVRPDAVRGNMEKAWHGVHFVLCGRVDDAPPPLGYLMAGGEEVGEDLGYGAARLLKSGEVIAFRNALQAISDAEFDRRFDVKALERNDIYPMCWDEDRDELLEEYMDYFSQLKSDLDAVVLAKEGLLIAIM